MEEIVNEILITLNKPFNFVIKPQRKNCSAILLGNLITKILETDSGINAATVLNISPQTFNRTIRRLFPYTKLQGGNETWAHYLLLLVNKKKCFKCGIIHNLEDIAIGTSMCINCRQNYDKQQHRQEANRLSQKKYYNNNPEYFYTKGAKRRALLKNACPTWVSDTELYNIYANCPEGYHVDHIIPLSHPLICGLHVPWNLQYLPAIENLRKSNKYTV